MKSNKPLDCNPQTLFASSPLSDKKRVTKCGGDLGCGLGCLGVGVCYALAVVLQFCAQFFACHLSSVITAPVTGLMHTLFRCVGLHTMGQRGSEALVQSVLNQLSIMGSLLAMQVNACSSGRHQKWKQVHRLHRLHTIHIIFRLSWLQFV